MNSTAHTRIVNALKAEIATLKKGRSEQGEMILAQLMIGEQIDQIRLLEAEIEDLKIKNKVLEENAQDLRDELKEADASTGYPSNP